MVILLLNDCYAPKIQCCFRWICRCCLISTSRSAIEKSITLVRIIPLLQEINLQQGFLIVVHLPRMWWSGALLEGQGSLVGIGTLSTRSKAPGEFFDLQGSETPNNRKQNNKY